jgi:signal transduction histidine kinase
LPAPASSPELAARARALVPASTPGLAQLMGVVRARQTGSLVVAPREARELGLPDAPAVAVTAPVLIEDGEAWSLALVASTAALSGQERTLVRRMLAGGGVTVALIVALSFYIVRNARRAAALNERLRLDERLLRSEKLVTAGQLAAGIAHEIGTPLNVIRARAELTIDRLGEHPEARSQKIVLEQVDHVSRLIAQLLDYVRIVPPVTQPVAVGVALDAVAALLHVEADRRGVRVVVETVADDLPALRADPGQLQQVLVNLAMNALDACERGGCVTLRARRADGATLALEVEDDGAGIEADVRAQIFDPFYTTKKRGQGTGLGLWVVAQLVRAHDAHIDLDSKPGVGTLVRITWPVAT